MIHLVSIHAPARGATVIWVAIFAVLEVSIHAPARGATLSALRASPDDTGFNSRSREGSDRHPREHTPIPSGFNSRSREGSDLRGLSPPLLVSCFNSRSREGSDLESDKYFDTQEVSIHAPARGATVVTCYRWMLLLCFNSRSREGSDGIEIQRLMEIDVSIHAPARGATGTILFDRRPSMFQFTLPRGERPGCVCSLPSG